MHVMCRMRRRIHACHMSYEEEDTCLIALTSGTARNEELKTGACFAESGYAR